MSIPFFNYPALFESDKKELMPIIENVLDRGAYVMQSDLQEFEEGLASYLGVKHAFGVADGTMALIMGLRAAGIGQGDEVIVPSHTFVASAASIHHVGAIPVLAECGFDHLLTDAGVKEVLTDKTAAIMPVQLNGRTANMDGIVRTAKEHNLKIIEDSAQALGSKFKDKFAGTFGVSGSCSFYPSKTLGAFGDGGAVYTDDDEVAEYIRILRDHGRSESGEVITWGYNSRLDNLQAAILNHKFKTYDESIERRRSLARIYHAELSGIDGLVLPPGPDESNDHFDIYQNYEIESEHRDALMKYLSDAGIGTIIQWGGWMIHQFKQLGVNSDLPFTEALSQRFLLLPMNTSLTDEDVKTVCNAVQKFYSNHS